MWETIQKHIVEISGLALLAVLGFVVAALRTFLAKRPPVFMRFNVANQEIHTLLTEARIRLNADRVFVCQFRNGVKFDIQAPLWRVYMTHESVGRGVASVTQHWSGLQVSQIYEVMAPLYSKKANQSGDWPRLPCDDCHAKQDCLKRSIGVAYLLRVKSLDEGLLKSMLIQQGTFHLLVAPMLDDGQIVGFLAADFRDSNLVLVAQACDFICHAASNTVFELKRAIRDTSRSWLVRVWRLIVQPTPVRSDDDS